MYQPCPKSPEGTRATLARELKQISRELKVERDIIRRLVAGNVTAEDDVSVMRDVVERWPYAATMIDRHRDVISINSPAEGLWGRENSLYPFFRAQGAFPAWWDVAPSVVARLRADMRHWPDERYRQLVGELSDISDGFRELWRSSPPAEVPEMGVITYVSDGVRYGGIHLPVTPDPDEIRAVLSVPLTLN